jgi:predicted patatin/cPLA2 family phospholipase
MMRRPYKSFQALITLKSLNDFFSSILLKALGLRSVQYLGFGISDAIPLKDCIQSIYA